MLVASVIVDVAARALGRAFDYCVPPEAGAVAVGCAVVVELRSRPVVGYVTSLREGDGKKQLKPILGVASEPYFDESSAKLAQWMSREYLAPLSECMKLFTPPGGSPKLKLIDGAWTLVRSGVGPIDDRWVFPTQEAANFEPKANAVKQRRVMDALSCGGMRASELSLELGNVSSTLKALEKRGVVRIENRRRYRDAMPASLGKDSTFAQLTAGQERALRKISMALNEPEGTQSTIVVDGITGSGKTEVYLRAISEVLEKGKTACVLVPEISLTPQTVGRFRARFGDQVAVLHSRLSTGERYDQWDLIRTGHAKVVVGARSALFAPLGDLGMIIIDEEHEGSYKQDSAPRYSALNVALKLAHLKGAVLVLGSATPSIETLYSCKHPGPDGLLWERAELKERPGGQPLPKVTIVDMGAEFGKGSRSMFSKELTDALLSAHEANEKAILLLNKRGFASFVLCRECGFVPECPECAVSLTYHEVGNALVCHHCGHSEPAPTKCPKCGSPYLRKFGAGTQRVEDELRAILPEGTEIVRMDADTTKGKGAHEKLLEQFAASEGGVLLGTQMIAKGLDFPDVTLVGVINADTTLKLPDYRAPERTYQLLEQVSGRAGRAEKPGHVIVQTYCPDHPAILAAASHDRNAFLEEELPAREELGYPPFMRIANILIWGKSEDAVRRRATALTLSISSAAQTASAYWHILGPSPCILSKTKGNYRWHILLKAPVGTDFSEVLQPVLEKERKDELTRIAVDVDPLNLI